MQYVHGVPGPCGEYSLLGGVEELLGCERVDGVVVVMLVMLT